MTNQANPDLSMAGGRSDPGAGEEIERDERGKAYPPRGATMREIARHYFYDVMAAEDESTGCRVDPDPVFGGPLMCCQWNGRREPCADCAEFQRRIECYAEDCIKAALRTAAIGEPPSDNETDPGAGEQERARQHELKTWPEFFEPVFRGTKTFELRKNDRDYQVGDELWLREWSNIHGYSGRECWRVVTYIVRAEECQWDDGALGRGMAILGIIEAKAQPKPADPSVPVSVLKGLVEQWRERDLRWDAAADEAEKAEDGERMRRCLAISQANMLCAEELSAYLLQAPQPDSTD